MRDIQQRTITIFGRQICYRLERKDIKNLYLRIHRDGSIHVSANRHLSPEQADAFILSRSDDILKALNEFKATAKKAPEPKRYISGETFFISGRAFRLNVSEADVPTIYSDESNIYLQLKDTDDFTTKQSMVLKYLNIKRMEALSDMIDRLFPLFKEYGVSKPTFKVKAMKTQWGSCSLATKNISLNQKLLIAPERCIEYVILHELCHLVHPNHSAQFYELLTALMPDWKEQKAILNRQYSID